MLRFSDFLLLLLVRGAAAIGGRAETNDHGDIVIEMDKLSITEKWPENR